MITLVSPAKVNLFLKVVRKREDGYHELVSLFQTISLSDTLTIAKSQKDTFSCSDPKIPLSIDNTVVKALKLFRQKTGIKHSFKIHIEKRIPAGAGLGGGSSNAATALYGLNTFLQNPLSTYELREIGDGVGSDVPFFLSSGSAICRGRGEIIEPMQTPVTGKLSIVMPDFSLSTKEVYQTLDLSLLKEWSLPQNDIVFMNDLEEPAFRLEPRLKELKMRLSKDHTVFMTGSGSALVVLGKPDCSHYDAHFITRKDDSWYNY